MSQLINRVPILGTAPLIVNTATHNVQYFPAPASIVPNSISATANDYATLTVPSSGEFNGQRLYVRASGDFLCPASDLTSPAVTVGLYAIKNAVLPITAASLLTQPATALFAYQQSASAIGIVPNPWYFTVNLMASTNSGILQGDYTLQIDGGSVQTGAITSLSGVNMSTVNPVTLLVGLTFSQSSSGNEGWLYQFDLQS